jgi:nitrile hydratase
VSHNPESQPYAALRAQAIESLLVEKGLISSDALDALVDLYERDIGPLRGARVVARAWTDPPFKARLLADANAACAELAIEGLRTRLVPRAVLREFGVELDPDVEVRVWDSSSEVRYMVLPERPDGTEHLSDDAVADLVTRDAMIGVARVTPQAAVEVA